MSWNMDDWKDIAATVGKIAPALGTILLGPAGGAAGTAVAILAKSLGVPEEPNAIEAALSSDPLAAAKIKQGMLDNEAEVNRLAYETTQLEMTTNAKIIESLGKADASGHTTRPQIAKMMAWMLAVPYVLIGLAIVYAVVMDPKSLKDLWAVMLAYLSIPLGILNKYFGDLRKEHAQNRGQQPDVGILDRFLGAKK